MTSTSLPRGWRNLRLKTVAAITPSSVDKVVEPGEIPVRLCNYLDVYRNERIVGDLPFMEGSATRREIERMELKAGDVVLTKDSETPYDIGVPALVEPSASGTVCAYHLARLRPLQGRVTGGFLFWAVKSAGTTAQFAVQAQGVTRFGLTLDGLGNTRIPVPPTKEEQDAIVKLLNASTARLDAMRDDCREAMRLAHERSLAIAANAIAELSQDAPLVELRRVLKGIEQGWSPEAEERKAEEGEWAVLKLSAVKRGIFRAEKHKALPASLDPKPNLEVRHGDLIISRSNGVLQNVGDACVVQEPPPRLMLPDTAFRLLVNESHADTNYLCLWLLSRHARQQIESDARGTLSMTKITRDQLRRWLVPLPDLPTQRAVVAKVHEAQSRSRGLMGDAKAALALLAERRAALIEAAVTGRLPTHACRDAQPQEAA